ncbi:DUF1317 family protein [Escherichia coli]
MTFVYSVTKRGWVFQPFCYQKSLKAQRLAER